jgi:hypothetical protein
MISQRLISEDLIRFYKQLILGLLGVVIIMLVIFYFTL